MGKYTGKREIPLLGNYHTPLQEVVMYMNKINELLRFEWGTRSKRLIYVIIGEAPERGRDVANHVNTQQDAIAIAQVFANGFEAGRGHHVYKRPEQ